MDIQANRGPDWVPPDQSMSRVYWCVIITPLLCTLVCNQFPPLMCNQCPLLWILVCNDYTLGLSIFILCYYYITIVCNRHPHTVLLLHSYSV